MSFCANCETYLAPDAESCPGCRTPRPPAASLVVCWSVELGKPPVGPLLITGELLLVPIGQPGPTAQHSTLRALDPVDGGSRWQRPFEHGMLSGLAAAPGGLILLALSSTDLLRGEGALLALDVTGQEHWRWSPGVQRVSAPVVAERQIYLTVDAQTLVALDLDGVEQARIPLEASASLSAPTVADDVAYVPCRGPHLLAVGLGGRAGWRFNAPASPNAWLDHTPVLAGEYVCTVVSSGVVLALRAQDGALAWQVEVGPAGKRLSPPATDGERLYVGARDGLHALDLADGRETWAFVTTRQVVAAPVAMGDVVYFTSHDHHLYALDAATGTELWRYATARRIKVPPLVTPPPQALALVADRGGTLTTVARPPSATEHETAGRWVAAASAYAALGQPARGAALLEAHGEPFKAAELWAVADRPLQQARTLEKLAGSLERPDGDPERCVAAWQAAAQAYEREGLAEPAMACRRRVARCLGQPIIALDVQHEGLVFDAWSHLQFIVRNEGYGPARNLVVRVQGDQFKGQVTATQQIYTLRPGGKRTKWLDVCPQAFGDSVPLRVQAEYQDRAGVSRHLEQTLYLPVARSEATRGEGQRIVIQGDYVAGDKTTGVDQRGQVVYGPQTSVAGDTIGERSTLLRPNAASPEQAHPDQDAESNAGWNTGAIRKLLFAAFDDEELSALCVDHFRPVYEDFTVGMNKRQKIQHLLDHCIRHRRVEELLAQIQERNPAQYAHFAGQLKA